jgi:hypothetical protein
LLPRTRGFPKQGRPEGGPRVEIADRRGDGTCRLIVPPPRPPAGGGGWILWWVTLSAGGGGRIVWAVLRKRRDWIFRGFMPQAGVSSPSSFTQAGVDFLYAGAQRNCPPPSRGRVRVGVLGFEETNRRNGRDCHPAEVQKPLIKPKYAVIIRRK